MKREKVWIYGFVMLSVAFVLTVGAPLRANVDRKYACEKTWTLTFPAGQGSPLHCARFEDGGERCSPDANDVPAACGNPSARDSMLILR